MTDMTKAEVLAIWKGLVKHMTDQGAVVPFAHEIASRVRNELLDRLEAAEKERDFAKEEVERLLALAHDQNNELIRLREEGRTLRAKIAGMERQEPVGWQRLYKDGSGTEDIVDSPNVFARQRPLYALPGAKGEET